MADNFNLRTFLTENKLTKNAQILKEEISFNGKPVNVGSIEIDGIDTEDYPDFVDAYIASAEYEDGTPLTDEELVQFQEENYDIVSQMIHDDQLYLQEKKQASSGDMAYTDKVEEALQESRLTAKERRLVEMVQDALGIAPQPVAEEVPMAEEEMVQEKPLPKYNSIEELMKEIEHGTNEAAHKYKMDEMKRVYEALEAKVGSLEEGEHAEHIDQKAVKQMRKDIAALRKAEEKLRKEFDKKFSGKEKKETPVKEKATEALQENKNTMENFDLKKFLAENKLTTNSRMLSENEEQVDELFGFGGPTEGDLVAIGYDDGSNEYGVVGPKGNQGFKVLYTGGKTDTQSSNSGVIKVGDPKGGTTRDGQREKTAPKVTDIKYANPKKVGFEGNPRSPKEVWDFYNKNWSKFK